MAEPPATAASDPTGPDLRITRLAPHHDRRAFDCGVESLNVYLDRFAGQNERAGLSQHHVAVAVEQPDTILGYHALSAGSITFDQLPAKSRRRLPRYPIPVAHLGRLAVATSAQGTGLGTHLLLDALTRIARVADEVGIHAVEVVALNDSARGFYQKYGFTPLLDDPNHLYLPLTVVRKLNLG